MRAVSPVYRRIPIGSYRHTNRGWLYRHLPANSLGTFFALMVKITGYEIIVTPTEFFSAELTHTRKAPRGIEPNFPECGRENHDHDVKFAEIALQPRLTLPCFAQQIIITLSCGFSCPQHDTVCLRPRGWRISIYSWYHKRLQAQSSSNATYAAVSRMDAPRVEPVPELSAQKRRLRALPCSDQSKWSSPYI